MTYECRGGPEEAYKKEEVGEEEGGWIIEREKTDSQSVFESDLVNNSEAAWVLPSLSGLRAEGYL